MIRDASCVNQSVPIISQALMHTPKLSFPFTFQYTQLGAPDHNPVIRPQFSSRPSLALLLSRIHSFGSYISPSSLEAHLAFRSTPPIVPNSDRFQQRTSSQANNCQPRRRPTRQKSLDASSHTRQPHLTRLSHCWTVTQPSTKGRPPGASCMGDSRPPKKHTQRR